MTRQCGTCSVCCFHNEIVPLNKPARQPCPHQQTKACGSCAIYDSKPQPCSAFKCSWLEGHGSIIHRPDECGVLFETIQLGDTNGPVTGLYLLGHVTDASKAARISFKSLASESVCVLLIHADGAMTAIGSDLMIARWKHYMQSVMESNTVEIVYADGKRIHHQIME